LNLRWLRKRQKWVYVPLAVIIIPSFILFFGGGERGLRSVGASGVAVIDGQTMDESAQYQRSSLMSRFGYSPDPAAPVRLAVEAAAARKAGIRVTHEKLREEVRALVVRAGLVDAKRFTGREYRDALVSRGISPPEFEAFVEDVLAARALYASAGDASGVARDELYLVYCREKDRIAVRYRDFPVKDREGEVQKPAEDELAAYYEKHKGVDLDEEIALATEPEVALEYAFVANDPAGKLAENLRRLDAAVRPEGLLGAPLGALAEGLTSAAIAAVHERELLDRYEEGKVRFRIPPVPPGTIEGGSVEVRPEVPEVVRQVAAEEPPAVQPAPVEPADIYLPFDEARETLEGDLVRDVGKNAARRRVEKAISTARERSRLRLVQEDMLLGGLALAPMPAALGAAGIRDRIEFAAACEEAGAAAGFTARKKPDDFRATPPMGNIAEVAARAEKSAVDGKGDAVQGPETTPGGSFAWRVADHLAPRLRTFEEAKEDIVKRIVHARAVELARNAAEESRARLAAGEIDAAGLSKTGLLPAARPQVKPFSLLGVGQVCPEPVALDDRGEEVATGNLAKLDDDAREETIAGRIAKYSVGVVAERKFPTREEFEKDTEWQTSGAGRHIPAIEQEFARTEWVNHLEDRIEWRWLDRGIEIIRQAAERQRRGEE